jgi:hypothetical protein
MEPDPIHTTLFALLVAWGVVTAGLICMLIYRSTLEAHEDDQIFLASGGDSMANEQRALVARIDKLARPIKFLMILSGILIAMVAGVWLWEGFKTF